MSNDTCLGPICIDVILQGMSSIQLTQIFNLCSLSLYIYDFVLTYDQEVNLMWGMTLSLGKFLYFAIRYFTLLSIIFINSVIFLPNSLSSAKLCTGWARLNWIAGIILPTLAEMTLVLRLYAMYGKSKKVLIICSTTTAVAFVISLIIGSFTMKEEKVASQGFGSAINMHTCGFSNTVTNWFKSYWAPAVFNETMLFILALNKAIQGIRTQGVRQSMNSITVLLAIDSGFYFFTFFVSCVTCWLLWIIGGQTDVAVLTSLAIALLGISSQRLLVNIRERYANPSREDSIESSFVFRASSDAGDQFEESY